LPHWPRGGLLIEEQVMAHDARDGQAPAGADGAAPGDTRLLAAAADDSEAYSLGYESADPSLHAAFWSEAAALRESP
jgi:hypothetical protein